MKKKKKFTLWRHDIDLSVHRAYSLAKIEKNFCIKATYFFLLGSKFYNIFEKDIKDLILKIISLGHRIGLHFDPNQYNINSKKKLNKKLITNLSKKLFLKGIKKALIIHHAKES